MEQTLDDSLVRRIQTYRANLQIVKELKVGFAR